MTEATARAMIKAHFDASNVGAAGGGPEADIVRGAEIYADDAVVEWPQGGERLRGKANIIALPPTYPPPPPFQLHVSGPPAVRAPPDHRLPRRLGQRVHNPLRRPTGNGRRHYGVPRRKG